MSEATAGNKRRPYVWLCSTPKINCTGTSTTLNAMMKGGHAKCHSSAEGVFKCTKAYYMNVLGYKTGDDSRSLFPPDGGEVLVLSRPGRSGAKMRNGKAGTRNMPHIRGHKAGCRGGTIVLT